MSVNNYSHKYRNIQLLRHPNYTWYTTSRHMTTKNSISVPIDDGNPIYVWIHPRPLETFTTMYTPTKDRLYIDNLRIIEAGFNTEMKILLRLRLMQYADKIGINSAQTHGDRQGCII